MQIFKKDPLPLNTVMVKVTTNITDVTTFLNK